MGKVTLTFTVGDQYTAQEVRDEIEFMVPFIGSELFDTLTGIEVATVSNKHGVLVVLGKIAQSVRDGEYGDIRSMLDEYIPKPSTDERSRILLHLFWYVKGATFDYSSTDGWGYDEDES